MATTSPTPIDRLLRPLVDALDLEAVRQIAQFRVDSKTQRRLDELAGKANEGRLSDAEAREYDDYIEALDVLGCIQARARELVRSASDR